MKRISLLVVALTFWVTASAQAMIPGGPPSRPAPPSSTVSPKTNQTPNPSVSSPTTPTAPSGGILATPDSTQALGGQDANCSHLQNASAEVVRNCASSGLAESAYPPSNYGLDVHVDTGITDPGNDIAAGIQSLINWIYGITAHVLTWILLGLGLAFNFDLFGQDHGGQITHGLGAAINNFTTPLLPIALTLGATVAIVHLLRREESHAVGHLAAMVAMIMFALLVAQNPTGVLGWIDQASNDIASGALAAFSGTGGGTNAGFADAVPGIYKTTMEEPWCSMEFGNVSWCMQPVDGKMSAARQSVLRNLPQALGDQGTPELAAQQAPLERLRLGDAQTNGELFLSFLTNSDARNGKNDDWTLYHALLQEHPELAAIRGPGGVGERFVTLVLAGMAGLFFLILLLYISWQLIVNSVFFVLCLLLTPVVVLVAVFGEAGRGVFVRWLVWMIEALFKKVIFAVYLGVILLVTRVFLGVARSTPILQGWLIQWLVLAGIWAMAFFYRHKILDVMTAGLYHRQHQPSVARFGGNYALGRYWRRVPQVTQSAGDVHEHHTYGDQYHAHVYVPNNGQPRRVPNYADSRANGRGTIPSPEPPVLESGD